MRIAVVGPGALGCLFATKLFAAATDDSVFLIDHRPQRAEQLSDQGIRVESQKGTTTFGLPVYHDPASLEPVDVLFSCVKSYDLENSLRFTTPLVTPQTLYVFLQNGIGHLGFSSNEEMTPVFGTTSEGATRLGSGHIRHAGSGHTFLGFPAQQGEAANERMQLLLELLAAGGLKCSISDDIQARLWAKLFVNVGINGLTAIHNCANGELLHNEQTRATMAKLVREAEQVAIALGITITDDPVTAAESVCQKTSSNISSMLQDVRNNCPTEIDAINGAVSRMAKQLDIATPENDLLIAKVKER